MTIDNLYSHLVVGPGKALVDNYTYDVLLDIILKCGSIFPCVSGLCCSDVVRWYIPGFGWAQAFVPLGSGQTKLFLIGLLKRIKLP